MADRIIFQSAGAVDDPYRLSGSVESWQQDIARARNDARSVDAHASTAEDAAMVLSLVLIVVLAATLITFLAVEFLDVLPTRVGSVMLASLFIFCGVVGRAIISRALALPSTHVGEAPVMRNLRHSRRHRPSAVPPIRA